MRISDNNFFLQDTTVVAKQLLGKIFCHKLENVVIKGKIVETEAYTQDEPSCHAYCGKTKRSETLFMSGGHLYVYMIYGMYNCVNIVTEKEGYGSAVLIRALEPINDDFDIKDASGPGKLCKVLDITRDLNKIDICDDNSTIWIENYENIEPENIIQTTRIGITKAVEYPWRFYIKNNQSVSKF